MTAKELIDQLLACDPDALVVMSSDGEGNSKSPLSEIGNTSVYVADSTWSGETYPAELTQELADRGFTEDDLAPEGSAAVPCVTLWPVN